MRSNTICTLVLAVVGLFSATVSFAAATTVTENSESVTIATLNYKIVVKKTGFKYSFAKPDGAIIAGEHPVSGLRIGVAGAGEPAEIHDAKLISHGNGSVEFVVTNINGIKAGVSIHTYANYAKMTITPDETTAPAVVKAAPNGYWRVVASGAKEAVAWIGDKNWADYSVECSLKFVNTVNASSASGLLFRFKDVNNYYHFRIRYNKVELLKKSGKAVSILGTLEKAYKSGVGYKLKAEIEDGSIVCYVDDVEVIRYKDPTPLAKGAAGLRTYHDTCEYDNFSVKSGGTILAASGFDDEKDTGWTKLSGTFTFMGVQSPGNAKKQRTKFVIDAQLASMSPVFGLGDHGGFGKSADVFGITDNDFHDTNNYRRFVSNFSVFPKQRFAQVLFEDGHKRVRINASENTLGAANVESVKKLYYFFGDMETIYASYQQARAAEGHRDFKPKYEFFEVGYEAFGSLGWATCQASVTEDLQEYLSRGYRLKWGVVGSGFWKGSRNAPAQGCTTSFGIWDDTPENGRNDKLPNPRYPDVAGLKEFFRKNDMKLFLGLRTNFKAPSDAGGHYNGKNDGPFPLIARNNGYFIKDENGDAQKFIVSFPRGSVYLLDNKNPEAVNWYKRQADLWGVDGFKEDTMLQVGKQLYNDAKVNQFNEKLMESGYYVMVRNSAYSVPGEIIRLEDTKYGEDQDRTPINGLNYAASGAPNFYPDIVAGKYLKTPLKEDEKLYFVRNAMFAAVCPSMSMGIGPWKMENEEYEAIVKKAADWHSEFAPYIYSAAFDSFYTGYPHTMTPLHIAYPDDENTYALANKTTRQYEWMLGPSLLATPAYGNDYATVTQRDVYLPEGKWIDYETGESFAGPMTLKNYALPQGKVPVFVGGKGVVVIRNLKNNKLLAKVYPIKRGGSKYTFIHPDGQSVTNIINNNTTWGEDSVVITDAASRQSVSFEREAKTGALSFEIHEGRDYVLSDGVL